MALGARPAQVLQLTLLSGLGPAASGLFLGIGGSLGATQLIRGLLYGVEPLDKVVFAGVALLLVLVATGACLIPAWRASRLDPMQALRIE